MRTPSGAGSGRRPTLEVVAERAGVSRATASRVLRGASNVSAQARDAVLRAADDLAYTVNRAARSLVTRRSDSIAFLVAEDEDRLFTDPYFLGILRGAHREIAAAGLQLVFVIASDPADVAHFEQYARSGHVDGVLLISLHGDDRLPQQLEAAGVPTVLNGRPLSGDPSLFYVDSDNVAGGTTATQTLLERGRRRIATITGPLDMSAGQDRLAGYRQALREGGVTADDSMIATGDFTVDGGARAMTELLERGVDFDGLFAASDLTALGAMRVLAEQGRRVPEEVAVVGFDDVREARLATPPLTTIRQPLEELGTTMARTLLRRVGNTSAGADSAERATVLPIELVRRTSA